MHHQQPCGVPTAFDMNNANYIPRRKNTTKCQQTVEKVDICMTNWQRTAAFIYLLSPSSDFAERWE